MCRLLHFDDDFWCDDVALLATAVELLKIPLFELPLFLMGTGFFFSSLRLLFAFLNIGAGRVQCSNANFSFSDNAKYKSIEIQFKNILIIVKDVTANKKVH